MRTLYGGLRPPVCGGQPLFHYMIGGESLLLPPERRDRPMSTLSFSDVCLFATAVIDLVALIWLIKKK